jgi:hypothetical protein
MGSIDVGMKTELSQYSHRRSNTGPYADDLDVDVIIVGRGFGKYQCSTTYKGPKLKVIFRWFLLLQNSPRA